MAQPAGRLTYVQAVEKGIAAEKARIEKQKAANPVQQAVSEVAIGVISDVALSPRVEGAMVRGEQANSGENRLGFYYGDRGFRGADFVLRCNVPSLIRTLQGFRSGLPADFFQEMEARARRDKEQSVLRKANGLFPA